MRIELTDEQKMVQETIREFASTEVAPGAANRDEKAEFPQDIIKKLAEMNFMGMYFPESYGGTGVDVISYLLAVEELAAACASTAITFSVHHSVGCDPVFLYGTEEQKQKYLVPLARGEMLGAFALTESGAGSDAAGIKTTAIRKGDEYVLNGNKMYCTNGSYAGAIIVMAVTDRDKGSKGISAFIVEPGFAGFKVGARENKLGLRASDTVELNLEDCRVPASNLLSNEGDGLRIALHVLDAGRIGVAAQAIGLSRSALAASIEYAKERETFGAPLARHQAIQWMLADMSMETETSRLLALWAGQKLDMKEKCTREAAMAKLYATEAAQRVTYRAIQIHGAAGYMKDYPLERYYRDARATTIYEGTSEIQRMVIARHILS
jgi:butyryl-CoA dehydrogenase